MYALLLAATLVTADAPAVDIERELDRLEALQVTLEKAELPEMVRDVVAPTREALNLARNTKAPLARVYRLRGAFIAVETLAFINEHKAVAESIEKLEALWKTRKPAAVATLGEGSLVGHGLFEAAVNRGEVLYRASLSYGKVSGALSGLYYLAEAEANAKFAALARSLAVGDAEAAPPVAKLEAAYAQLEKAMLKAFEKDPVSPPVIGVSVRLKEARELLDRGSLAGATLLLLESRRSLERLTAAPFAMPEGVLTGTMASLWSALAEEAAKK